MFKRLASVILLVVFFTAPVPACELCAIYSANNAREDSGRGFLLTIAEQYVAAHTLQYEGKSAENYAFYSDAFLNSSYAHVVPGYNFSSVFGVSLNMPIIYRDFRRTAYVITDAGSAPLDETGTITGLGDVALVGRLSLFQKAKMTYSMSVNLLAGIKFPTGDTGRLDNEVSTAKSDSEFFQIGHASYGGVHEHDLTLGSGSYDGVFGVTSSFRWKRWFVNNQTQYYLRTEGHSYKFGDMFIVSGGPGVYFPLGEEATLSLQANGFYERNARDEIIGQTFNQTGMTAWYLGPLLTLTVGEHFSANVGVDVPLKIYNHGFQTVPDLRVHAGLTWRF